MWQVIKLCKWVSSLFLYMFKITHGKQAKYHFKYLGLIEAFVILQKRGHTRKIMRGTSYVLILSLYLSRYYMCCSSRAHWLLVLRQYLYHTRPSSDRQPSQSLFGAQWCFVFIFYLLAALASIFGCNASEWWVVSKWLRWERSTWIELNFLSFIRFSRWLIEKTGHRTARYWGKTNKR